MYKLVWKAEKDAFTKLVYFFEGDFDEIFSLFGKFGNIEILDEVPITWNYNSPDKKFYKLIVETQPFGKLDNEIRRLL